MKFHAACSIAALAVSCGVAAQEYPASLPPQEMVRNTLEQLPQVKAARNGIDLEEANAGRLRAGPYEWTVKGGVQRRTETVSSTRYRENELAMERPMRWFGKGDKDRVLGEQRVKTAGFALADTWHEAGRAFLRNWFDAMREARTAARLQEQADLLKQQSDIVRKRVKAGDAPRVELMLTETEYDRASAAQRQAEQRAARMLSALQSQYPGMQLRVPQPLPEPAPLAGGAGEWKQRILADNHEIELARSMADQEKLNAERLALDRVPDPTFGVRMAQERDRQEKIVGVTFSIPLSGSLRRSQHEAGLAQARIAEDKAMQVTVKAESEAMSVAMNAEAAYETWHRLAQVAKQTDDNTALVSKAYSLGEASLSELLLARRQSMEAAASAEAMQLDALEAQARLLLDAHLIWQFEEH